MSAIALAPSAVVTATALAATATATHTALDTSLFMMWPSDFDGAPRPLERLSPSRRDASNAVMSRDCRTYRSVAAEAGGRTPSTSGKGKSAEGVWA